MPFFTVIVPCWNAERYVDETLTALAGQTLGDFEAILVDDGSADGTRDLLRAWSARDRRFRVVLTSNGGPSRARNLAALSHARGEALAFLDADDVWAPRKLEASAAALDADEDVAGAYARIAFFRGRPETAKTTSAVRPGPLAVADVLDVNPVCTTSNLVVRRCAFAATGGFDPSVRHSEDLEWLLRAVSGGARIVGLDETLVYYRTSDASLSFDLERMHEGWRQVAATAAHLGHVRSRSELRRSEAAHLRYLARRALRVRGEPTAALRYALRSLKISPSGFFSDPKRGALTLAAALVNPLIPGPFRALGGAF